MKKYYLTLTLITITAGSLYADGDLFTNYGRYVSKVPLKEALKTQYGLKPDQYTSFDLEFLNASAHGNLDRLQKLYQRSLKDDDKAIPRKIITVALQLAQKSYHGNTVESIKFLEKILEKSSEQ